MKHVKIITGLCVSLILCAALCVSSASPQEHIRRLDDVRTAMTSVGSALPDLIRKAEPQDIRTLERLFEINNYALVTIESYLKMIKIALASGTGINKDVLGVLNGWLKFMAHYCEYDIKYIDEALGETTDATVVDMLKAERKNIEDLRDTSQQGVKENTELSSTL